MSSETSRTAAATGKAYRALKDLVRATLKPPYCPLTAPWSRASHEVAALLAALTHPTPQCVAP